LIQLPPHLLRGQQTRDNVMAHAVHIATREGLEALTIGRVAESVGIAKASLLGHYGSKEQLQLATLDAGAQAFVDSIVLPASQFPEGIVRLRNTLDRWLEQATLTDGGCLFASVAAEFDTRPGPVRTRVRELVSMWQATLAAQVVESKRLKHMSPQTEPEQLVFALYGVELSLNLHVQLFDDRAALTRARTAMAALLRDAATPLGKRLMATKREGGQRADAAAR
jgi:AcrR family transcriptional regulator